MKITREKLSQTSYLKEITALQEKYLHLQNAYRSNARFVHDISAHLQSIASLAASGKTERVLSYIDSLNLDPALSAGTLPGLSVQDKAAKITAYTGLDLIDLILNDFCLQAKSRSVSITITASLLPVDSRISDKDFSSLFVNLLKNALENAGNWITVTIKPVQEMLFLQVINDFPGEIRLSGNLLLTTKENSLDHGFGTVLVQEICRKYDGYALFTSDNRTFSAEILITL
ncbi:MAG: GHKL domain-containing protein [Lachnospiraceae bacterium]|nr:GHKL domain-containing protein [Lachnospiraceae bacterium]